MLFTDLDTALTSDAIVNFNRERFSIAHLQYIASTYLKTLFTAIAFFFVHRDFKTHLENTPSDDCLSLNRRKFLAYLKINFAHFIKKINPNFVSKIKCDDLIYKLILFYDRFDLIYQIIFNILKFN